MALANTDQPPALNNVHQTTPSGESSQTLQLGDPLTGWCRVDEGELAAAVGLPDRGAAEHVVEETWRAAGAADSETQALDDVDGDLAGSLPEGTQLQQLLLRRGQAAAELAWGRCRWSVVREHQRFGGLLLKMILAQ